MRLARPALLAALATLSTAAPAHAALIVRFKTTAGRATQAGALRAAGAASSTAGTGGDRVVQLRGGTSPDAAVHTLRADHAVAWAAPEYAARVAQASHNDTGVAAQTGTPGGWAAAQWDFDGPYGINAPAAWDMSQRLGDPGGP
jgi:hypothetical protein